MTGTCLEMKFSKANAQIKLFMHSWQLYLLMNLTGKVKLNIRIIRNFGI